MSGLYVVNLGCKVNRVESDSLLALAQRSQWIADREEDADIIVVNTCTVTGEAQKKTRKAIRQALRSNEEATIIVTGCAAAIDSDELAAIDPRIVIVSKPNLESHIEKILPSKPSSASDALRVGERFRTRVGIKVQDGCANACTYCIVHTARGKIWSKPSFAVIDEARRYMEAGVRELVFAGINLGSYRDGEMGITDLVSEVLRATDAVDERGIPAMRLRLSSIEPCDIDDAFIELLASSEGRVCRHLHIPVQSGSSKVLSEMSRPYDAREYLDLIGRLYAHVPKISISTDIIVGFPGETDQDFTQTLELARACRFSKIHVFPYSRRKGTPAAIRPDQIDSDTKRVRSAVLRVLSDELREQDVDGRFGDEELVIVERAGRGLTESYHEVKVSRNVPLGSMVRARIERGSCVVL